jgi:hypothetical protein
VDLQFNIEEIVGRQVPERSLKEFGGVNVPRTLRTAQSEAGNLQFRPTVSAI